MSGERRSHLTALAPRHMRRYPTARKERHSTCSLPRGVPQPLSGHWARASRPGHRVQCPNRAVRAARTADGARPLSIRIRRRWLGV
eukprot:5863685-Prymnesium_polylepis.1